MSKQFWYDFLELYMSFPCLWNVNDETYRDRLKRSNAMSELLKKLREVEPTADGRVLTKKVNGFRTTFRTVHRRYVDSCKSGAGVLDVAEPTLWYYKLLLPIVNQSSIARRGVNTLTSNFGCSKPNIAPASTSGWSAEKTHFDESFEDDGVDDSFDFEMSEESGKPPNKEEPKCEVSISNPPKPLGLGKKKSKKINDLIEVACEALAKPDPPMQLPEQNRFCSWGRCMGLALEEIHSVDPMQSYLVEKLCNEVIFQARMGNLQGESVIGVPSSANI